MTQINGLQNCLSAIQQDMSNTQDALNAKANLSGATFTGDISANNLSGTNTGDQDLSGYAELSGATFTGAISATNLSGTNTGDETKETIIEKLDGEFEPKITYPTENPGIKYYRGDGTFQEIAGGGGSSLSAGMSLFGLYKELPSAAYVWGDAGKQELNNASTNYSNLVDNITGGLIPSDTIAAWDAAYAANPDNAVPFWGYDSVADKVIVPNIPRGYAMTAAGSLANTGTVLQNAAPNITGTLTYVSSALLDKYPNGTGAFTRTSTYTSGSKVGGSGNPPLLANFNLAASTENDAYGRDSTTRVRNDQIQMRVLFYVGAEVSPQEASQITAAGVLSDVAALNGLTGQGGATPISDYVVETYVNGTTWYRKYKSGWVEQGGLGKDTITLPVEMASSTYYCLATRQSSNADSYCSIVELSATQITVKISTGTAAFWEVKGMAA